MSETFAPGDLVYCVFANNKEPRTSPKAYSVESFLVLSNPTALTARVRVIVKAVYPYDGTRDIAASLLSHTIRGAIAARRFEYYKDVRETDSIDLWASTQELLGDDDNLEVNE